MSQNLLRPIYLSKPIGSVSALSRALDVSEAELRRLAANANDLYRLAKPIIKADGSIRQPFDAKQPLKALHARLKDQIFANVEYPAYLTGSLRGRDYVTNAKLHVNKRIVICEDIKSFFPSVRAGLVHNVWLRLFSFSPDVAHLLTLLTTKDGALPQGAITSSYLANLVLFEWEPLLYERFLNEGISYSRYVDDIAISSQTFMPRERQTKALASLHGMLAKAGLKAKRSKHETLTAGAQMRTTKLVVNKKVSLAGSQRDAVRTAVFQVENLAIIGAPASDIGAQLSKAAARVGHLKRFHAREGEALAKRLALIRDQHIQGGFITVSANPSPVSGPDNSSPWDE